MNRQNQILVVILVLQLIVAAVVLWPRPAASGEGESLFPDLEADRVARVTITSGGDQTIHLAKLDGEWVLADADGYPVQGDKVPGLLDKITAIQAEQLVTQTGSSHKRLKVAEDDFERLIEIEMDDGSRYLLYVGTSPRYSVTHIRAGDQDEVYLTSELSVQDAGADAMSWVDRTYLDIPSDQIVALTLENANGRFEFERVASGGESEEGTTWTMKGLAEDEPLDQGKVTALVKKAASTNFLQPLGKEEKDDYGMQEPNAIVYVKAHSDEGEDKTYTLWIGAQDPEDKSYVITSSESPYYVRVSEFVVKDLVEKARDGFLQQPTPTPTPQATPQGQ